MSKHHDIEVLGEWQGYRVKGVEQDSRAGREQIVVKLEAQGGPGICSGCGRKVEQEHERVLRRVRDLPVFGFDTVLMIERRRMKCERCGSRIEALEWLDRYARVTKRLAEAVARLCQMLPVKQAAEFYGLSWEAAKEIHKSWLKRELGPVDLRGVAVIGMDEFAIQKGHRYATVIVEPRNRRVLWVGRGRGRKDIRPFFELLGSQGRARLQAVVMDMSASFREEVEAQCPDAKIVYDQFHVVAKYGREVMDRTRVEEANRLRNDKAARKVVKGSRWLLLRNKCNIKRSKDRVKLKELLAANKKLAKVYVMKDDLKHLWDYRYPACARRFWKDWYNRAVRSRIAPLVKFAKALKGYIEGIINHCHYPLHTSLIEGINNKIKVIKRVAYGYRDDEYFFLRIRAAFPGIPR